MKTAPSPPLVLHVITDLVSAGAERALGRLVLSATRRGHSRHMVVSLMNEGAVGRDLRNAGIELHCLNMKGLLSFPLAVLRLARLMRQARPDVVMTWLYHADMVGTFAALLGGRPPVVWNLRCSDMDFSHYAFTTRWAVAILARLSWLPAVVTANSKAGQTTHTDLGYRPKRWLYVPNGFDPDVWKPDADDRRKVRADWGLAEDDVAVGLVARVDPQKDHATFLKAASQVAARCKNVRFVLIGAGTEDLSIPAPLSAFMLVLGERPDIPRLLRGLDVAALSSSSEGFPNVVGEAMATGLPCAVTDVGDAAALVGKTGLVVPARTPDALATALEALIQQPEPTRRDRGRQARNRIVDRYHIDQTTARFESLWHDLSRNPAPATDPRGDGS